VEGEKILVWNVFSKRVVNMRMHSYEYNFNLPQISRSRKELNPGSFYLTPYLPFRVNPFRVNPSPFHGEGDGGRGL